MMSIRALVRSAPRTISRLSSLSSPALCRQSAAAARSSCLLKRPSAFLRPQQISAFSTSQFWRASAGETDEELSAKLESEIQFENEVKEGEPTPASVKDFLENGPFEIVDTPGEEEVTLTRTFGNEKITVSFSISDLANYENDLYDEDPALGDEDPDAVDPATERGANSQESSVDELADEAADDDLGASGNDAAAPCRLNITVEKSGKGALNIEATAQDGNILVENLYYYADAALAHGKTAEVVHAAQDAYPGPPFGSLDEDLQILVERYLEERGITQALAVFVPDYMDMKEQREYLAWLNNLKTFIDA